MADRRTSAVGRQGGRRKKRTGLILSFVIGVVVVLLLVTEQVALLYVLATLSVSALLVVVALASFGEARGATEPAPFDDAAAISDRATPVRAGAAVARGRVASR